MATITVTSELDVISKYRELITTSTDVDSIYIRTKETLLDLFESGDIKAQDKAEVIVQVLAQANSTVVQSSMSTALQWANIEKEIELKKLELAKQLDILDEQITLTANQAEKAGYDSIAVQADTLRQNGAATVVDGKLMSLSDAGVMYENILLTREKVDSENKAQTLSDAKVEETYAGVHKIIADTYVNYGMYSGYSVGATGVTGINDTTPSTLKTLSYLQGKIATEQAKGYAYNAWANAASGLGSTIGVALTSETDIFTGDNEGLVSSWKTTVDNLRDVAVPVI